MRKILLLCLIVAVLLIGCSKKSTRFQLQQGTAAYDLAKALSAKMPALDPASNKVLASGKGFEITVAEVIQTIQDNIGNRTAQLKNMDAAQLKRIIEQSAAQLGERKLLSEAATKAKTVVAPEELDKALQAEYGRAGGEQAFLEVLKTNGISIDFVKTNIQTGLLINKYLDGLLAGQGTASEDEIQKAYQGDKTASVRHILLLTQGKTDQDKAEIRKKMEEILARAKSGDDFAALAKQYTEDPGSKENGGLYENFSRGNMVKPFEEAAFSVPIGEISGIIETEYGYHIIKVIDRQKETRPFAEVRAELESKIKRAKQDTAYQTYLAKLKQSANFKTASL
jgi:parvulin-like peptidyl-prolyl isomerase